MYLQGIDKQALPGIPPLPTPPKVEGEDSKDAGASSLETRTEADEMVEKIYSNMSACHMKNGNWKRALDCAERVSSSIMACTFVGVRLVQLSSCIRLFETIA
jgi:hypothetical protein